MQAQSIAGRAFVEGSAQGVLLVSGTGLSFWGGVDPTTGEVIDQHHPLQGRSVAGKILAIPGGRGSCSGSGVLLELMANNCAPAALVFSEQEEILTLGVLVSKVVLQRSIPVLRIDRRVFTRLQTGVGASIRNGEILLEQKQLAEQREELALPAVTSVEGSLDLSDADRSMLAGEHGRATQIAMRLVVRIAEIQGAKSLIDITQAHIDACVYNGPTGLRFAQQLVEWGAQVRVPTTLNALSVDMQRWREQGVAADFAEPAGKLGAAYIDMGAQVSFTCAPYLLSNTPKPGQQIVWAESNAVMYANSVIGARTQKYPDFLDISIALTGRAPAVGCHLDQGRLPEIALRVVGFGSYDDAFWPVLGYHLGLVSANKLPIIYGLEASSPSTDDLKAFSAAFATTSSAPMFHMAGITPEANLAIEYAVKTNLEIDAVQVGHLELVASWQELNTATRAEVDLVSLGNPHFSLSECASLAQLCRGRSKAPRVEIMVTLGRAVFQQAQSAGYVDSLIRFGVHLINDTCWCMLDKPVIPPSARTLITNSGKYAHYAPGLVGMGVHFASLADCVNAACQGYHPVGYMPAWLQPLD